MTEEDYGEDWERRFYEKCEPRPNHNDTLEIQRLAKLSVLEYEREREAVAERLGARPGILDKLVQAERDKASKGKRTKTFSRTGVSRHGQNRLTVPLC